MGFFSRNNEALQGARGDEPAFDARRRSPGNVRKPRAAVDGARDTPAPLDPAETAKTRARRRLIGAVALAAAAVVFVPMLFDRTPVAQPDEIALTIPDRDTPFEGRKGVPDPARAPLKGAADLPSLAPRASSPADPAAGEPGVSTSASPGTAATQEPPVAAVEAPVRPVEPATKSASKSAAKDADVPTRPALATDVAKPVVGPGDDPKALAALEGRGNAATLAASGGATPVAGGERTFAVQIAAYSSADKARAMRDTLVANGLRSYVESVSTPQGLRTRVRLGPFTSRDAADHAKEKLKTMKLDGSVVPL